MRLESITHNPIPIIDAPVAITHDVEQQVLHDV